MKIILILVGILLALFVLICYSALIVAVNEDEMYERQWRKEQREKEADGNNH